MSALEPAELRYLVISIFGVIILTAITFHMGMAVEPASFAEPEYDDSLEEEGWWETGDDDDSSWYDGFGSDTLDTIMNLISGLFSSIANLVGYMGDVLTAWSVLFSAAGWAATLFLIPQLVMWTVILALVFKAIGILPTT